MNTDLRKIAKNDFGKTMGNVRKHRDIKHAMTEKRKNYLASEPNYHRAIFSKNRDTYEYTLWLSILELSEIVKYEFLYAYVKPSYGEKGKLLYWYR